jgi:hypothetical protein
MLKRTSKTKKRKKASEEDVNLLAHRLVEESTSKIVDIGTRQPHNTPPKKKNPAAVALGRLGGLKGGKARMEKLTPERRREIASDAARVRWSKESR